MVLMCLQELYNTSIYDLYVWIKTRKHQLNFVLGFEDLQCSLVNSYFMPVCTIVKTIKQRFCGRPDTLLFVLSL